MIHGGDTRDDLVARVAALQTPVATAPPTYPEGHIMSTTDTAPATTETVWPKQLRKRDVIVIEELEYTVRRVDSVFGGSWFDVWVDGEPQPVTFGNSERVTRRKR